jgi:hypothetical protein
MTAEDADESPHVNTEETDKEVQDWCPAFDDDLDSEVDDFAIEEDDHVFMTMVHLVDPYHFVRALSTVSGRLAEAFGKDSKPKVFEDIVLTSLHAYADVFGETATYPAVQVPPRSSCLLHQEERWKASIRLGLPSAECDHQEKSVPAPSH